MPDPTTPPAASEVAFSHIAEQIGPLLHDANGKSVLVEAVRHAMDGPIIDAIHHLPPGLVQSLMDGGPIDNAVHHIIEGEAVEVTPDGADVPVHEVQAYHDADHDVVAHIDQGQTDHSADWSHDAGA